mmetsp:Transcript_75969/g.210976  ORF Transcript_75969/g.210976 Transcript_75969/m.210976 type:complete len:210 (-) Transcript_75969:111-740(-)
MLVPALLALGTFAAGDVVCEFGDRAANASGSGVDRGGRSHVGERCHMDTTHHFGVPRTGLQWSRHESLLQVRASVLHSTGEKKEPRALNESGSPESAGHALPQTAGDTITENDKDWTYADDHECSANTQSTLGFGGVFFGSEELCRATCDSRGIRCTAFDVKRLSASRSMCVFRQGHVRLRPQRGRRCWYRRPFRTLLVGSSPARHLPK